MSENITSVKGRKSFLNTTTEVVDDLPIIVLHGLSLFKRLDEDCKPTFEFSSKVIGEYLSKYQNNKIIVLLTHESDLKIKAEFHKLVGFSPNFHFIITEDYKDASDMLFNLLNDFNVRLVTKNPRSVSIVNFTSFLRNKDQIIHVPLTESLEPYNKLKLTPDKEQTFTELMKARNSKWSM